MITVRDLSWQYEPLVDGGKPVDSLKHVSFDIKSGSFVGVIGPTGAGKSTLCMALAGIIPNLADGTMTGLVEVNGMNTSRHSVSALSERIGYVQQDPEAQLFCASVEDEIAFPLVKPRHRTGHHRQADRRHARSGRHDRLPQARADQPVGWADAACGHRGGIGGGTRRAHP